jgi:glycerophosphoryl diester phosphodiesterase
MAKAKAGEEKPLQSKEKAFRRVGHKGADAVVSGNTLESFDAAIEMGVDMIELDVLRDRNGRLIIAHDYRDALKRQPLGLSEALDAFLDPPLDQVEIDCDLKLPGREAELAGALEGRGLIERAMVSTMEIESLQKLKQIEPDLRRGWTYPKTRRDWMAYGWAKPGLAAGIAALRRRFPKALAATTAELEASAVWAFHQIITPRLVEAAEQTGVELIAWTVDEADRMRELLDIGVHGICTNDPRLFAAVEAPVAPPKEPEKPSRSEKKAAKKEAKVEKKADKKADKDSKKNPEPADAAS